MNFFLVAIILFFNDIYFTVYSLVYGYSYISYTLESVLFIDMMLLPFLIARMQKNKFPKTIIGASEIISCMIPIVEICIYPVVMSFLGEVPYVMNYIAVLCEVVLLFLLFIWDRYRFFHCFTARFIPIRAIWLCLSISFILYYLAKKKKDIPRLIFVIVVLFFGGLMICALPNRWQNIDITEGSIYSVTKPTEELLKELKRDVTINVLSTEKKCDIVLKATLKEYQDRSKHILVNYVDSSLASLYDDGKLQEISTNSLLIEEGNESTVIEYFDLYEYAIDESTYYFEPVGYKGEKMLTNAIFGKETQIFIPVKKIEVLYLDVPQHSILIIGCLVILILPIAVLSCALILWLKRRNK